MSDLALQLIKENKRTKNPKLDLGNCGLKKLPHELFDCIWLEELNLRDDYWENGKLIKSPNNGGKNALESIQPEVIALQNLKVFRSGGLSTKKWYVNYSFLKKFKKLELLDLVGNSISDIWFISLLSKLQSLDLSFNQISDISCLQSLTGLQSLNLQYNQISDISYLQSLVGLKSLGLKFNQISDISYLQSLVGLQSLNLSSNQISDVSYLQSLVGLKSLSLGLNQISDINCLQSLTELQSLDLSYNKISNISYLQSLIGLQFLYLDHNQISDISCLQSLTGLQFLHLDHNQISNISYLQSLTGLQFLYLDHNQISNISYLQSLTGLQSLLLHYNQFSDISFVSKCANLKRLTADKESINPLGQYVSLIKAKKIPVDFNFSGETRNYVSMTGQPIFPPPEIMGKGEQAIIAYFNSLEQGAKPLNEIKVLLIGDGAAGKTSLVKNLCLKPFNEKEPKTHGIQIQDNSFVINNEEINVHFWDFGGQEIMHATHRFFLTTDCVYILVLDGRRDERPEYWLKHIATYGGNAPVLVVLNKCEDNRGYDIEKKDLNTKFSNIKGYYKLSCKTGEGVATFKDALQKEIYDIPFRKTPFSPLWTIVKDKLSGMDEPFITYSGYYEICHRLSVTDKDQQQALLVCLNRLGIVLHFEELRQYDTQVLNPLWLTQAVYRVINSPIVAKQHGEFNQEQLFEILNDPHYDDISIDEDAGNSLLEKIKRWFGITEGNSNKKIKKTIKYTRDIQLSFIARVMEQFELSYSLDDGNYIIPDLLPVELPNEIDYKNYKLSFAVDFYFLPPSLLPRFMVQTSKNIKGTIRWRNGVVLNAESLFNAEAIVRTDKENKRLEIYLNGPEQRELLVYIRSVLEGLYSSYEGMKGPGRVKEWLFLPDSGVEVELEEIEGLRESNVEKYTSGKARKSYLVDDIIQSIENPVYTLNKEERPIKIFISYSRAKRRLRDELVTKLFPLTKSKENFIELWIDENSISPGANWREEIDRGLKNSEIIICLLSDEYFASEYCMYEFNKAYEQNKVIYPVLVNICPWRDSLFEQINGYFVAIEPIPKAKRPHHWQHVYENVKKLIKN